MARPPKEDRSTVATKRIDLRVSPEHLAALQEGAGKDRKPLSAWLRDLGLARWKRLKSLHRKD